MGPLMKHVGLMYVAKCPVIVILVHQVIERTRRVVLMAAHTTESRMEDTNIEIAGDGFWICQCQIGSDITLFETLPVKDNA